MPDTKHAHTFTHDQMEAAFSEYDALRGENEQLRQLYEQRGRTIDALNEMLKDYRAEFERLRKNDELAHVTSDAQNKAILQLSAENHQWRGDWLNMQAENERLLAALLRLVELGEDDGSAPDSAWKDAFTQAAQLVGRDNCG